MVAPFSLLLVLTSLLLLGTPVKLKATRYRLDTRPKCFDCACYITPLLKTCITCRERARAIDITRPHKTRVLNCLPLQTRTDRATLAVNGFAADGNMFVKTVKQRLEVISCPMCRLTFPSLIMLASFPAVVSTCARQRYATACYCPSYSNNALC